jgi:hypothetical protein
MPPRRPTRRTLLRCVALKQRPSGPPYRYYRCADGKPRRNERGIALYPEAEVRRLAKGREREIETLPKAREALPDPARVEGKVVAKIFEALERGVPTVQIVIDLDVHADLVEAFHVQWARMKGMVLVSEETLTKITQLPGYIGTSIGCEEELLAGFRSSLRHSPALCAGCREAHSRICLECRSREHAQIRTETEKRVRAEYEGRVEDGDAVERQRPVVGTAPQPVRVVNSRREQW